MAATRADQILDESAALFARRGYPAVSVREIGQAVGISGPALYRHFPSKNHILATLVSQAADRVETEVLAPLKTAVGQSPEQHLHRVVDALSRLIAREATIIGLYQREYRHLGEPQRGRVAALHHDLSAGLGVLVHTNRPSLSKEEIAMRVRMLDGVFTVMRDVPLGRIRTEALTVTLILGLLLGDPR